MIEFGPQEYLKTEKLRHGYLYKIYARHVEYGIYCERDHSFYCSRMKFNKNFVDHQIHYDWHEWHGTVKPLEEIEKSPFDLEGWKGYIVPDEIYQEVLDYLNQWETHQ
jgi:hypothetical protein